MGTFLRRALTNVLTSTLTSVRMASLQQRAAMEQEMNNATVARLVTAAALTAFATVAGAADSWTSKDKAAHAGGSAALAAGITKITGNEFVALAATLLIGAAKEGYDSKHPGKHCASWKDITADAVGGVIGSKLGGAFIAPERRGFVVGFQRAF